MRHTFNVFKAPIRRPPRHLAEGPRYFIMPFALTPLGSLGQAAGGCGQARPALLAGTKSPGAWLGRDRQSRMKPLAAWHLPAASGAGPGSIKTLKAGVDKARQNG